MTYLLNGLWLLTSIFLILVVLIQRGRGGGLAGAFGGAGGSSAFGTRAGDVMTKITVGVFVVWIVLCLTLIVMMTQSSPYTGGSQAGKSLEAPKEGTQPPLGDAKGAEVPLPPPVDKAAGAAPVEEKKEAAPKADATSAPAKEEPKPAPVEKKPAAESKSQPAPKAEEPATKASEPAVKKQG